MYMENGKADRHFEAPQAEAVQLADENVGVVLNSSQSYVWERGNRQQGMRLDETTMPSGFQSASLDENVLKESLGDDYELLNLTGCTREEILYMISSGYGVVVKTGANESLLLTGYDIFGNSWLYNPATGETTALSDDDSDALFAQNGNVFISYIKKCKDRVICRGFLMTRKSARIKKAL